MRAALMVLAASGAVLLAGCSTDCPAIGWIDSLTVNLDGDTAAVHRVQLCVDGTCSQDGFVPYVPEALHTVTPGPELTAGAATPADAIGSPPAGSDTVGSATAPADASAVPPAEPSYQPTPGATSAAISSGKVSDTEWEFQVLGGHPQDVTVRVLDAEGGVLAEQDAALDWKRVGGSERCGGPHSTPPITVHVSS